MMKTFRSVMVVAAVVLSCVLASGAFAEDPYTGGTLTVTWETEPTGYLAIGETTEASVSADYDPNSRTTRSSGFRAT